jgi:cytochrome c-type biogenesis protein CcmH/NrfF
VLIDGNTGQLRELDLPRGQHLGNTITTLLWGIHYGDLRNWLPYRILIGLFGVFLAVISYTGVVIWWRKRQVRKASRGKLPAVVALVLLGLAAIPGRTQIAPAPITHEQDALIRKIEGRLMAPCCYTQTIRDHDSQVAVDMRNEVTAFVASGKSEQEIITYYRTKYGETILVVPDGLQGHLLTIPPLAAFFVSASLLLLFIRKSVTSSNKAIASFAPVGVAVERPDLRQRIREQLGDF